MSAHTATKGFLMSASTMAVLAALGFRWGYALARKGCPARAPRSGAGRYVALAPRRGNAPYAARRGSALAELEEQGSVRALANFDVLSDYSSSL